MKIIQKTILFFSLLVFLLTSGVALAVTNIKSKPIFKPLVPQKQQFTIISPENPNSANGIIIAITSSALTISQKRSKKDRTAQTKIITFNNKTEVNKDKDTIKITDLKIGDNVRITLELLPDKTYVARSIRVVTAQTGDLIKKIRNQKI
jgi:hypothetical protein